MNVLILAKDETLFRAGGGGDAQERHVHYARRLRERHPGSDVRVITYTRSDSGDRFAQPAPGLTLYGTGSHHRALYLAGVVTRLRDVLGSGWRPDVLTVQTPWEEGVLGWLLARRLGARFLPQLHFDLFSEDWLAEHPLNRWRRFVAARMLARADLVRVVSTTLRDRVVAHLGVPPDRVGIAPVGVTFAPERRDAASCKRALGLDGPVVLFVGRLCEAKNLELWLDVAGDLSLRQPGITFLVAGDGPLRGALERRAQALGIGARVRFLGSQPYAALPVLYRAADVFLLASHYEGFGRVVLEAQLSGLAVVSTRCGGPEDLITSGQTGVLVPKGDRPALADAVGALLTDAHRRRAIADAGCAAAARACSFEALSGRVIDLWERACAS